MLYILNCLQKRWVGAILLQDFFNGSPGIYEGGGQDVLNLLDPVKFFALHVSRSPLCHTQSVAATNCVTEQLVGCQLRVSVCLINKLDAPVSRPQKKHILVNMLSYFAVMVI